MTVLEAPRCLEVNAPKRERVRAPKEPPAGFMANKVANGIAKHGRDAFAEQEERELQPATGRKQPGRDDRRVAREEKADKQTAFGEEYSENTPVTDGTNQLAGIHP